MASLRTDVVTNNSFYVPNLLPKSTPRKKKTTKRANSTGNKIQLHQDNTIEKDLSKEGIYCTKNLGRKSCTTLCIVVVCEFMR